jgi:hypothetical protein
MRQSASRTRYITVWLFRYLRQNRVVKAMIALLFVGMYSIHNHLVILSQQRYSHFEFQLGFG